jgi:hypothetical protein
MLNDQATKTKVNLTFSKKTLHLLKTLRIKELLSQSQVTEDDAMALDKELKSAWWQQNQACFLAKIQTL